MEAISSIQSIFSPLPPSLKGDWREAGVLVQDSKDKAVSSDCSCKIPIKTIRTDQIPEE